jgi:hypothetical protein
VSAWDKQMREMLSNRHHEFERRLAVWVRGPSLDQRDMEVVAAQILKPFGKHVFTLSFVLG